MTINKTELSKAIFEEDLLIYLKQVNWPSSHYGKISKECGKASFDAIMKSIEFAKQDKVWNCNSSNK